MSAAVDLRLAGRALRRRPVYAATAIATIAVGIASCVATFRWIDVLVLHPLSGVPDPSRIVTIETLTPSGTGIDSSYPDGRSYRDQARSLSGVAAMKDRPLSLGRGSGATRVWAQMVSGNFFDVLGVRPEIGRFFSTGERREVLGLAPVVVIGDALWRSRFSADPAIVGRTILINDRLLTVIGVTPRQFQGTISGLRFDLFVPLFEYQDLTGSGEWLESRDSRPLHLQARLAPGATIASARSEIRTIAARLAARFPDSNRGIGATVNALSDAPYGVGGRLRPILIALSGLSVVFLLLVSANVAGLLLARTSARERELAIRGALGASRGQVARPVLAESLLLCGAGGVVGIALSLGLERIFLAILPATEYPVAGFSGVDPRTLAAGLACTVAAMAAASVFPTWAASRVTGSDSLRSAAGNTGQTPRLRSILVAGEIALATLALAAAALFVDGLRRAAAIDPGFRTNHVLVAGFNLSWNGYSRGDGLSFYRRLETATEAMPGVTATALAEDVPLGFSGGSWETLEIPGYTPARNENMKIYRNLVSPGYFGLLDIPILAGRDFAERDDRSSAPVAIVNQTFARRYFGRLDPLGRSFRSWGESIRIVGVARDAKYHRLDELPQPYFYVPLEQFYSSDTGVALHLRTSAAPGSILPALRGAVTRLDPRVSLLAALPLSEYVGAAVAAQRIGAGVLTVLAALALALAGVGLFGVIAYTVETRRREIGLRLALGATARQASGLIVGQGLRTALLGLAVGLAGSVALGHFIASAVFNAAPTAPATLLSSSGAMLAVSFLAAWLPARRAARIDPMTALRSE